MDPRLPSPVALNEWITPSLSSLVLFGTLTDVMLAAHAETGPRALCHGVLLVGEQRFVG